MALRNSETGYFRTSIAFVQEHKASLWWAFCLPLIGALGLLISLFRLAMGLLEFLTSGISAPSWLPAWVLEWGTGFLGTLFALLLAYLLLVPLTRVCLAPLLGLYAEKVYSLRRGEAFDNTHIWHFRFWLNQIKALFGGMVLALYQLPLKFLAWIFALIIPGGFFVSAGIEFWVNRHFVALDNFGLLLMAGPRPVVSPKRLKKTLVPLDHVIKKYKNWAGLALCIPLFNVFFMLINVTAAALILADHGGPELQGVE